MNDDKKMISHQTKAVLIVVSIVIAIEVAIGGYCYKYDIFPFGKDDEKEEKSGIYAESYYDFEENTGIDFNHASSTFQCFQNMTAEMKTEMTEEVYEDLLANQSNYDVKFTGTENIGIVHVIAVMLTKNPRTIKSLCQERIADFGSNDSILKRLFIELACHIRMRKKGGSVCLTQYNEYLYKLKAFDDHKTRLMEIKSLNTRAIKEHNIIVKIQQLCQQRALYDYLIPQLHTSNDIDRILPAERRKNLLQGMRKNHCSC